MKHVCKMNTVVLKSFNDRLKIATVSALMAGTFLCVPFTVYAESLRYRVSNRLFGISR